MFIQVIARNEPMAESRVLPRSLDYAARRAKLRRERGNRAAPLGMTEGGNGSGSAKRNNFAFSVIPSGRADFLLRSRCANVGPKERDRGNQPHPAEINVTRNILK